MSDRETTNLVPGYIDERNLPRNLRFEDLSLFQHEFKKSIPATETCDFSDVYINPDGVLFHGNRLFLFQRNIPSRFFPDALQLNYWKSVKGRMQFALRNRLDRKTGTISQTCLCVSDPWCLAYFHWICDVLPRLFVARKYLAESTLLLPLQAEKLEFIRTSLIPFGCTIKYVDKVYRCRRVLFVTHTAPTGNFNGPIVQALRSMYLQHYAQPFNTYGDRIYVSRNKASRRRIADEQKLLPILEKHGFSTVFFEDHSFEDQVKIAMNARIMVSNHGAGLTNMHFMPSGGKVLELRMQNDAHSNCYFSLASALGLDYYYQLCVPVAPNESAHTADLAVAEDCFERNLVNIVADS